MSVFQEKAREAWGSALPDWVAALARACDSKSQSRMAAELGVNAAYLSYALRGRKPEYHGMVESAVRARLMGELIACPVLGEIAPDLCRAHRRDKRRAQGPVQKELRLACPECPLNPEREEAGHE